MTTMSSTPAPLRILDCSLLILSVGRSAQNLRELRDHLTIVPTQSISHHFYDSLLRPTFDHPEYRNDFARWAGRQLRDELLAERLGIIDPIDYPDLEALRQALVDVIEDRLAEVPEVPQAPSGQAFHFLGSRFVIIETGVRVSAPGDLAAMLPSLSTGSIFIHFIEARRRTPFRRDDFSAWLEQWGPEYVPVCKRLQAIDHYLWSLTELRELISGSFAVAEAESVRR